MRGRIPELDGFRAIAILWVLLHHAAYAFPNPPGTLEAWPRLVTFILSRGWLGVDLFFVLSGFLITGILLDSRRHAHYWRNFYARRVLRILPVYFVVLAICWIAYDGYSSYFVLSVAMLANFAGYFSAQIPHGPGVFWSLAVEEHFYFIWPLMVWLLGLRALGVVAGLIVVFVPVLRGVAAAGGMDIENEIYVYSWFRFDGLALGALVAVWVRSGWANRPRSLQVAAGFVLVAVLVTLGGWPYGLMQTKTVASAALRYTQVQLVFAAAILASVALRNTTWTGVLRSGFLRLTSDYSYCMYLVHLSLGDAYVTWLERGVASSFGTGWTIPLRMVAISLTTYGVASLSFHWLEQPFLQLKRLFDDRPAVSASRPSGADSPANESAGLRSWLDAAPPN